MSEGGRRQDSSSIFGGNISSKCRQQAKIVANVATAAAATAAARAKSMQFLFVNDQK